MNGYKKPPAGRVALQLSARFFELAAERGWDTQEDHADAIKVHQSTISRVLSGDLPNRNVIAGIMREFWDEMDPRELFVVVPDEPAAVSLRSAA